jgi:hypothetical protein
MNLVKKILLVLFLTIPCYTLNNVTARDFSFRIQKEQKFPLHNSKPTTFGINYYVKTNENKFIEEFEELVGDSLYDVYITVDDIRKYTDDSTTLGYCATEMGSSEIIITNEPKYLHYEYSMLTNYQKQTTIEANNIVKGVIFHELAHNYFNQVMLEMRIDTMFVSSEYNNFNMIPKNTFGSTFIEEGIAVYVTVKKGECIFGKDFIPKSIEQIQNKEYKYYVKYNYSVVFVRPILDKYGIKEGIKKLLGVKPPSYEEMMSPQKYYDRLNETQKIF